MTQYRRVVASQSLLVHAAARIEQLGRSLSPPSFKQHLACIRMLFDWLVTGQVVPRNPAHSVRGVRHSVSKGVRRCCPRKKRLRCSPVWMFQA